MTQRAEEVGKAECGKKAPFQISQDGVQLGKCVFRGQQLHGQLDQNLSLSLG